MDDCEFIYIYMYIYICIFLSNVIMLSYIGWSTINFGTPEAAKNQEMEDRLKEAERWVSKHCQL
jgi:hypothetical protein